MSQAKPVPPVQVKVTKPDRRISESSSKSSTHKAPPSVGKGGSVTFNANEGIPQHRRDSTGQLLLFPIEFGRRRRSYSWQGHPIPTKTVFEPTYRTEPTCKIPQNGIREMMEREMDDLLHDLNYSKFEAPNWSRVLTERLKSETKKFLMEGHRYKIVASVVITQDADQNMQICSRCLWETEYDTVISHTYKTKSLIAVANIYCVHTP